MKKTVYLVVALIMILTSFSFAAGAAGSGIESATEISFGQSYSGVIVENGADYYKITLPSSGNVKISLSGNMESIRFCLYNASGNEMDSFYKSKSGNSDTIKLESTYDLVSGDYYIVFSEQFDETGNYNFNVSFSSAQESFEEKEEIKNNSLERSSKISFGNTYKGQIAKNDSVDYYKITLPSSGNIKISLSGNMESIRFCLYNASGNEIDSFYKSKSGNSDTIKLESTYDLVSGDYYIVFSEQFDETGNYSFSVNNGSSKATQPTTTRPADKPTTTRPTDKPVTTRPADKPTTTRPADKPTTTRPAEVNTTQKKEEKTTKTPVKAPEYTKSETYVNPQTNPQVEIYIYIDFEYTIINNYVIILNYIGNDSDVVIPEKIDGYEVKGIGDNAFAGTNVESVSIPDSVNQFGSNVFGEENGQGTYLYCSQGSAAYSYADRNGVGCVLNMVEYPEDSSSSVSDGLSAKTIAVIAAVAVLVIGAVIVVVVIGMKKTLI